MEDAMVPALSARSTDAPGDVVPVGLLSDDAADQLESARNTRSFLEHLVFQGYSDDALKCVARLLPREYVILWALSALRRLATDSPSALTEKDRVGIALAERWLRDSKEESRLAAQQFAEADDYASAGAWIAAAAAWMAGSLAPPELDPVPPASTLPGEAIAAALIILASRDPELRDERLARWVTEALRAFGGAGESE